MWYSIICIFYTSIIKVFPFVFKICFAAAVKHSEKKFISNYLKLVLLSFYDQLKFSVWTFIPFV